MLGYMYLDGNKYCRRVTSIWSSAKRRDYCSRSDSCNEERQIDLKVIDKALAPLTSFTSLPFWTFILQTMTIGLRGRTVTSFVHSYLSRASLSFSVLRSFHMCTLMLAILSLPSFIPSDWSFKTAFRALTLWIGCHKGRLNCRRAI